MMLPFIYNIYKMYANFSEEFHQVSLSEWTMNQLRNGMITFMMKALQEVLGEKQGSSRTFAQDFSMAPVASLSDSFLSPADLVAEKGDVDTSDKEYIIGANSESVISDYLIDVANEINKDTNVNDELKLVELAPMVIMYRITRKGIPRNQENAWS